MLEVNAAQQYAATMDSVNLVMGARPVGTLDTVWADTVARNKAHIQIMLDKDFWTTEDLTPFQNAIK